MFTCRRDFFGSCCIAVYTCVGFYSRFCIRCWFCYSSRIPDVVCFCYCLSWRKFKSAIFTVGISGVAFLCTRCGFDISKFRVLVVSCCWDFFCFCCVTACTSVGFGSWLCTRCRFRYFPRIPGVVRFGNRCSRWKFCSAVFAVSVSGVALIGTRSFFAN